MIQKNNLNTICVEKSGSDTASLLFVVKAGPKYEDDKNWGYGHFLEHILLKGTVKRPTVEDLNYIIDSKGAFINAYTGSEYINILTHFNKKDAEEVFELLSDIVKNPLLNEKTVENEKKVIIEEMRRKKDNPSLYIWDVNLENIFKGNSLSKRPLGSEKFILTVTKTGLKDYYNKFFKAKNSALICSGGIVKNEFEKLIHKYFFDFNNRNDLIKNICTTNNQNGSYYFEKANNSQSYIIISYLFLNLNKKESFALAILANYLGYGGSSLLKQEIRHKKGLAYSVKSGTNLYNENDVFYISTATTHPAEIVKIVKVLLKDIRINFTEKDFKIAKDQFMGVFLRNIESPLNEANFIANSWLKYGEFLTAKKVIEIISNIKYEEILTLVEDKFSKEPFVTILGPEDYLSAKKE